jgi:hypothetical protein
MKKIFQFFLLLLVSILIVGCFGPGWWDGGKYNGDSPKEIMPSSITQAKPVASNLKTAVSW